MVDHLDKNIQAEKMTLTANLVCIALLFLVTLCWIVDRTRLAHLLGIAMVQKRELASIASELLSSSEIGSDELYAQVVNRLNEANVQVEYSEIRENQSGNR